MTTQNNYVMHIAGPHQYYKSGEGYTNKTRCKLIVPLSRVVGVPAFISNDVWFAGPGVALRCVKCNSLVNDCEWINSVEV